MLVLIPSLSKGQSTLPPALKALLLQAQTETSGTKTLLDLQNDLNMLLNDSLLNSVSVGVYIASLKTKEVLFARNEHKAMIPASNMKIISSASAMDFLGSDFTYTTTLFLDGLLKKSNGEFVGNVIIRGAGDPSMSTYFYDDPLSILRQWCGILDSIGVRSIRGNLVGDDSYFDDEPWGLGWSWDDVPYAYSAQISALSFYDNSVDVIVKPAFSVGQPAEVQLFPATSYVTVSGTIRTVPRDSLASISIMRQAYSNIIYISGSIAADTSESGIRRFQVSVDNPTLFLMSLFRKMLEEQGITVRGGIFDAKQWGDKIAYAEMRPVCYHSSPPLREIIRVINTISHNLCAEQVWRTAAKEFSGKGNADKAADMTRHFGTRYGISFKGAYLADGSGLSRFNLISPKQIADVLSAMYNSKHRVAFMRSLAVPGERGTLQNRLKGTIAEKVLKAKTGTLTGVSSLSGYITTRDQEPLVFSLMFNGYTLPASIIRTFQDIICLRLANFARK
ncbi:MAG: D-alanyl-D-alanine carboxypeptidase/D-alanyl-D-alanine-endopeptidase [Bacteroidota bacterium]|nr:D-alanyl-D-alanine carboxypeptidase/D-alanyl-D-alanine-endopeptidase [Bacteroidota bacterium]